jgi:thioredoxin
MLYNCISLYIVFLSLISCSYNDQITDLNPKEFQNKINDYPEKIILDVRTKHEFESGFIENAINIDWTEGGFTEKTQTFDKDVPIFVYCLSGGRSSSAANKLRSLKFKNVFELNGGLMKWKNANLPLANSESILKGLSLAAYNKLHKENKYVLIDFYAEWCKPCKEMEPFLDELSSEMKDSLKLFRINVEEHTLITKELNINDIPVLMLYKEEELIWENIGFIEKDNIKKEIH